MKSLLIGIFSVLCFSSLANENTSITTINRDSLVSYARQFLGTPYVYGGSSQNGFDCSGFVHYVFSHFNVAVSRTSRGFKDQGKEVELENSHPGDVILFTGTNSAVRQIGHVGIIIANAAGVIDFIHSSSSKNHYGVTITRYNASGYVKRFMSVINILG